MMKLADIKRPEVMHIASGELRGELSIKRNFIDPGTGELDDILIAPTLILSDKANSDGKLSLHPDMFNDDLYKRFNNFTYSIGKMVRLAELNLDTLIDVIRLYLHIYTVEEILKRNAACKELAEYDIEKEFNNLTFMNMRKILSCIVKTDKELHKIENLKDAVSRKNFTTVYTNYIEDRDKHTHGILFFLYPGFEPILRIKTKTGDQQYIKYDKVIFIHNLLTFDYLTSILTDIREFLQKKLNGS